jgi:methionyl aminopeptidase
MQQERQLRDPGTGKPIRIYGPEDFAAMRRAGRLAAETLDYITPYVQPGVATGELDRRIDRFVRDHGATPATLGYRGYPKSCCISVNHVVNHGIPDDRKRLKEGDILNIDVTVILDGWYGDTSRMFYVGEPAKVPVKGRKLVEVTFECMWLGIRAVRPGGGLNEVGWAIQRHAEAHGFAVVEDFVGHGVGRDFHEPPNVHHFKYSRLDRNGRWLGRSRKGVSKGVVPDVPIVPGMIFTIEPMINAGTPEWKLLDDNWTAVTRDRSLSAQFEHTVGVTEDGVEIFTLSPAGWHRPPYDGPQDLDALLAGLGERAPAL